MSDRSIAILHSRERGPSHVTVTEKRAPTDESVRLLREMEAKAKNSVNAEIKVEETVATIRVQSLLDAGERRRWVKAIVSLNGHKLFVEHSIDAADCKSPQEIVAGLRDELAKQIANEMIQIVEASAFAPLFDHNHPHPKKA
jgi:hypothetical protein